MIEYHSPKHDTPPGPYTPVVQHNNTLYVSGQGTFECETGKKYLGDDIFKQTTIALQNLKSALEGAGSSPAHILKVTLYTTALERMSDINRAYTAFFDGHYPARTAIGVDALPGGMLIEIEAIAAHVQKDHQS